ncbi:MAG TPA: phosphoribosylaminoimidazolesuccinocarboxamide synthase, partial [Planctomycetes bacterium]|nr:phosphoribosylaminoimidazolesuccinocarboxamide synthase [Planctomycetota bacterium]
VIMAEPIPDKGKVLTTLAAFWFRLLGPVFPNHLVSTEVDEWKDLPQGAAPVLRHRTMRVKRAEPLPVEFVVRGYLTGSGWKEYQEKGSVCGVSLPPGLRHAEKLPEPIFTPTTKAEEGHDLPLTFREVEDLIGAERAHRARAAALDLYTKAHAYALKRRFVIADTKLEFGILEGELILIDEAFTPDSSRFWPAAETAPGARPPSYDKQVLRNWLLDSGWDRTPPPPALPPEVIRATAERYREICRLLSGLTPEGVPAVDQENSE